MILAGVAVAASGAVCAGVVRLPDPAPGRRVLSEREAELTGLLGDAIWPEGNPIGVSSREARLVDGVDELLADTLGEDQVAGFRHLLRVLDLSIDIEGPPEALLASLQDWQSPDMLVSRVAIDGIKAVLGMAYFNDDRVLAAVGFSSRCHV
ncbi:MAG TPA: hypothetical protein QGF58_23910 [Myxococcota bacterium]|nr:hypothetical protein [Myxococcota bacterium]